MPAPYGRRDWQTRADRALGRMGRGSQQGRFPGTRPVPPSSISGPTRVVDYRDSGQLHKVDQWTVTDDTDDSFHLTYPPMQDSWNVSMGWPFHEARYTISGQTLTILDPTDTFRGIATNGSRTLRAQYDYLEGVPSNPGTSELLGIGRNSTAGVTVIPSARDADTPLLFALAVDDAVSLPTITGWTQRATSTGGTTRLGLYTRTASATTGDNATGTLSAPALWSGMIVGFPDLTSPSGVPLFAAAVTGSAAAASATVVPATSVPEGYPEVYAWAFDGSGTSTMTLPDSVYAEWYHGANNGDPSVAVGVRISEGGAAPNGTHARTGATGFSWAFAAIDGSS